MMFTEGFFEILFTEKRFYKFFFMENLKVVDAFAKTDVFHRNLELVGDADNHAAFGCAIEFGDGEFVNLCGGNELACLLECVMAG